MARSAGRSHSNSPYSVHPGVAMVQNWIVDLPAKTGRSLEDWISLVKKEGPASGTARREWLKKKYQLGTNSAWWIADRADGKKDEEDTPEAYLKTATLYVEAQYAGAKSNLKPIYDALLKLGLSLGPEVKVCPCKTIVPLYRNHVFAQIKPTTNARVDLGFALAQFKGKIPKTLVDTGGLAKKDRITHRFELSSVNQIDKEVKHWLQTAYDLDS